MLHTHIAIMINNNNNNISFLRHIRLTKGIITNFLDYLSALLSLARDF